MCENMRKYVRTIVSPLLRHAIDAIPNALSPPPDGSIATNMCLTGTGSGFTRVVSSSTDGCLNARVVDSAVIPIDSRRRSAGSSASKAFQQKNTIHTSQFERQIVKTITNITHLDGLHFLRREPARHLRLLVSAPAK